jgi:hypothetical protein
VVVEVVEGQVLRQLFQSERKGLLEVRECSILVGRERLQNLLQEGVLVIAGRAASDMA